MKWYMATIDGNTYEMILADSEEDAINQYFKLGEKHDLCNLKELNNVTGEVRRIL